MKYELLIYGADDELIKTYGTNICPWAVFIQAADMQETLAAKTAADQMKAIGDLLKTVFIGLTDEELLHADAMDVMNTFQQIVNGGQKINGGSSKNANRARG